MARTLARGLCCSQNTSAFQFNLGHIPVQIRQAGTSAHAPDALRSFDLRVKPPRSAELGFSAGVLGEQSAEPRHGRPCSPHPR